MNDHAPPVSCEYETPTGHPCNKRAIVRLTIEDTRSPKSISGEPVKYTAHACAVHGLEQRHSLPIGMKITITEQL